MSNQINIGGQNNPPMQTGKLSSRSKIILTLAICVAVFFTAIVIFIESKQNKKTEINTEETYNSKWDASVFEVEQYLKENLRDPDSYESIEWGKVIKSSDGDGTFAVRHKYRAKNGFGGYGIEEKIFIIKNRKVIQVSDYVQ